MGSLPQSSSQMAQEDQANLPSENSRSLTDEISHRLESYRELIDFARAIVWRADPQTFQFTFVSNYAETLLGYPLQSWTDEPTFWRDHIHPEDTEWAVALCAKATAKRRAHELEYRMIAADGRDVWLYDIVRVVVEDGRPKELVGVMVDITEKKNAEEELRQSDARLRQIVDTIPEEVWSGPADGTLDFANERWRTNLGLGLEDLQGEGWQKMLHPDDRDRVMRAWEESVRTGIPYDQEERHRQADGSYRWVLSRGLPLRDDQGRIVRWFGSNTDIEDKKRAENALRESEQRWRAIFENSSVGVALFDPSFRFLTVNKAFEHIVGYKAEDLYSLTCLDLTDAKDLPAFKIFVNELTRGQRDRFKIEKRYRGKDGKQIWVRVNASLLAGVDGEAGLWVGIVEDITERKH